MPRRSVEETIVNAQLIRDAIRAVGNIEQVVLVATPRRLSQLRVKCDVCNGSGKRWGITCPECYSRRAEKTGSLQEIHGIPFFEASNDIEVLAKATDLRRRSNARVFMALDGHSEVIEVPDWLIKLM